jgi:hypothetical protein
VETKQYEPITITGVIVEEVGDLRSDGFSENPVYDVPFRLSRAPSAEWGQHFLKAWHSVQPSQAVHQPGIDVGSDRIILDGTTIDDVERYHVATLRRAVAEANELTRLEEGKLHMLADVEEQKKRDHRQHVAMIAARLRF